MTTRLSASTAGKNWILASQPSQWCNVPEKSRKSRVTATKQRAARMTLIFLSILMIGLSVQTNITKND